MTATSHQSFSIIIPARDEEQSLPLCVESIKKAAAQYAKKFGTEPVYEIVVVINRCKDATEDVAKHLGCRVTHCEAKNLAIIRNTGVHASQNPWCITIDADSLMSSNYFISISKQLSNPRVVGGGVLIVPERISLGILVSGALLFPITLILKVSGGSFYFRRTDFEAIGGFPEEMVTAEDIGFALKLRKHGRKTGRRFRNLFLTYIITSCRKFDKLGDWYFIRNIGMTWRLLWSKDKENANKIWYDIERS